ncbi:MAG: hypothetical protein LBS07_05840 [Prevotellaceae bacterium]|jgi:hypothetical protein|nr:hypothetical protein [Prevotellaceae bacterium]
MALDVEKIIEENNRRKADLEKPYNPKTGLGGCGERELLEVKDAPFPLMFLPRQMMQTTVCRHLKKYGSIQKLFQGKRCTEITSSEFWISFCELRYKYDFEFFAYCNETIIDKLAGTLTPFVLNEGQRLILQVCEEDRLAGIPMRYNYLKSRQVGGSTFFQMYFKWIQIIHHRYWNSVICAHVQDPAKRIRAMYDRSIRHMPEINGVKYTLSGFQGSQNIKEIKQRGCTITVGTALEPDGVRSDAVKLAHLSEIAHYPNTDNNTPEKLEASITSSVPEIADTMIVRETTANGMGYFHEQYQKAKNGETAFRNIFIPWHRMKEYTASFDKGSFFSHNGRRKSGLVADFIKTLSEYEQNLFENHKNCTLEHLNWYRRKASTMPSVSLMKQEYPSNDIEAFQFSGMAVFEAEKVERLRKGCCSPVAMGDLVSDASPSLSNLQPGRRKDILSNIRFVEDKNALEDFITGDSALKARAARNKLKIWEFPDTETRVKGRYVVTIDPQKGLSEKADYGVISVLDRYWTICGGKTEVVAQWRGRLDKDIEIWLAAQIAKYYNNALLVVECNTYDTDSGKVDDSEYIFGIIKDYYGNIYRRDVKDKVTHEIVKHYGFHTGRASKTTIIENYRSSLREQDYVERDADCLDEALVFEQDKSGRCEAKKGWHDDILMSRMIGLYVAASMAKVELIHNENYQVENNFTGNEAVI